MSVGGCIVILVTARSISQTNSFSKIVARVIWLFFFFFNDTATTEIYTLSLHDALPIWFRRASDSRTAWPEASGVAPPIRSEEHTSELQSQSNLVCRLLLEKKKKKNNNIQIKQPQYE